MPFFDPDTNMTFLIGKVRIFYQWYKLQKVPNGIYATNG